MIDEPEPISTLDICKGLRIYLKNKGSLAKPCVEYLAYKADISNIVCTFACKEYCNERESLYDAGKGYPSQRDDRVFRLG